MNRSTSLKIIIPTLFLLAAGLIIFQHFHSRPKPLPQTQTGLNSLDDYYQAAKQMAPNAQQSSSTVTFLATGDIMLSRNVALEIGKANDSEKPFKQMSDILKSTDFNFGNLESPIGPERQGVIGGHSMIFSAPPAYSTGLGLYNFKILNLANNHAFDQGLRGLNFTRNFLDEGSIGHIGTGNNLAEAWQPAVVAANDIKVCFIGASYSSINDNGKTTNDYVARIEDTDHLKTAVATAKSECDFVVVTMHAGTEYTRKPNLAQITFAHAAVDDGADIVIGAHPHWIQTTEKYWGKYIFYSLGNFIFDQNFSPDTMQGLTLKIQISKAKFQNPEAPSAAASEDLQGQRLPASLDSIELLPIIIQNSQPRLGTEEEKKSILYKIGQKDTILK